MPKSIQTKEYAYLVGQLRKARLMAGFTQAEAARQIGRPQSHISNIESGQQRVDVIELQRFAKLYKQPLGYFLK